MQGSSSFFDNQPLRYYRGHAVYLTLYLTLALAAGIVLTILLESAGTSPDFLGFVPPFFLRGALWQPFTYVFVNPISFFTPFSLLCFYFWGVEVEKYMGRRRFAAICVALLATPVLFCLLAYELGFGAGVEGDILLISGLLISFATLYPDMDYLGGWVPLKWFAFICIACGSLMHFPMHDLVGLALLWINCLVGFASIQFARGRLAFPRFRFPSFRAKPKFRIVPKPSPRAERSALDEPDSDADALLDKIARYGLQSLTAAEHARLEKARQDLLNKGKQ